MSRLEEFRGVKNKTRRIEEKRVWEARDWMLFLAFLKTRFEMVEILRNKLREIFNQ